MLTCHKYITALVVAMGVSVPSIVFAATSLPLIQYNCPPASKVNAGELTAVLQSNSGGSIPMNQVPFTPSQCTGCKFTSNTAIGVNYYPPSSHNTNGGVIFCAYQYSNASGYIQVATNLYGSKLLSSCYMDPTASSGPAVYFGVSSNVTIYCKPPQ